MDVPSLLRNREVAKITADESDDLKDIEILENDSRKYNSSPTRGRRANPYLGASKADGPGYYADGAEEARVIVSPSELVKRPWLEVSSENEDEDPLNPVTKHQRGRKHKSKHIRLNPRSGPAPQNSFPWAYEFPGVFGYYMRNTPDFTGIGLYRSTLYTAEFGSAAARTPLNFTLQALLAEQARFHKRMAPDRLRKFKGYALRMINEALDSPGSRSSIDLTASVATLLVHDMIFDPTHGNAQAHIDGLERLIHLQGGLEFVYPYKIRLMIVFTFAVYGYLTRSVPRFWNKLNNAVQFTARADSPIRLAIQPTHSNLPSWRLYNHLMVSYGAPITYLLRALAGLGELASAILQPPYLISPQGAKIEIARLNETFIELGASHKASLLVAPEFSDLDSKRHDQTSECARLVGLVLLSYLDLTLENTEKKTADLDFIIQNLLHLVLDPHCAIDLPILAWALISAVSLLEKGSQRQACINRTNKALHKLRISSWEDMQSFLQNIFFCPPLQEKRCYQLWVEVGEHQRKLHAADRAST